MGGKSTSTSATKLNQISVQSSSLGVPITAGWGRARTNCNLLWYGAFNAIPHTTKQSGGKGLGGSSSNTTYTYTASIIMGLCEGGASGIQGVRTVYRDKSTFSLAGAGLSLATGTPAQAVWGYLSTKFPSQAINYSGIAYVYAQDYALDDSASLPNHSFEIDFGIQLAGAAGGDADPKDIVSDCLTNAAYGVPGWPAGMIGDLSDWSLYCRSNNLLLSPVLDSQRTGQDFFAEIATATNSEFAWSEGVLKIGSYGDSAATGNGVTWTPNLTPAYDLTEDDLIPVDGKPVKLNILDQSDAFNIVQVEFLDRSNQYNVGIQTAQDLADIVQNGKRKQDPTTIHSICDPSIAQQACQLLLQRTLYMREEYTFRVPDNFALLEPMIDTVTLTTTTDELRLSRKQVRITHIVENPDGTFDITAKGMNIGNASAALYNAHSGSGYVPNLDAAPGSVSAPLILNAPTSLTGGAPEVWIAASGTDDNWGGYHVWVSADDIDYQKVGTMYGAARLGQLTASLASHADPDTTNVLSVDLTASRGALGSASAANADQGATLCMVGTEMISYQTAALSSTYHYDLSTLRRGLHGTTIGAWSASTPFARIDDAIFKYKYTSLTVGSTMFVKLQSFNVFGRAEEDLSTVEAYSVDCEPYVTVGEGALGSFTLINRENCYIDGRTVTKIGGTNTWGDASVISGEGFRDGAMVAFEATQTDHELMLGLNEDPVPGDGYSTIDFAWHINASGGCNVYLDGNPVAGTTATYAVGDRFQVNYRSTSVEFWHNTTLVYTLATTPGQVLYLDSSFFTVGAKITNVVFAGVGATGEDGTDMWTPVYNGWAKASSVYSKTAAAGWGGNSIQSLESFQQAHMTFQVADAANEVIGGLVNGSTVCGVHVDPAGHYQLSISGTDTHDTGIASTVGDVIEVAQVGTDMRAYLNGADFGTVIATGIDPTTACQLIIEGNQTGASVKNITFSRSGVAAPMLSLASNQQAFTFDGSGAASPATQNLTVTANLSNVTGTVTWAVTLYDASNTPLGSPTLSGTGNSRTLAVSDFGSASYVVFQATLGSLTDTQRYVRLTNGSNAFTPYLTNDAAVVATAADGTGGDFGSAGGTFELFVGSALVPTGSIVFSVPSESGVTVSISATGVYTVSGMSADTGVATLRARYNGVNYDKIYTIAKSKAGSSAPDITLSYTALTMVFDSSNNSLPAGQSISLGANLVNISGTVTWAATAYDNTGTSLGAVTLTTSGNTASMSAAQFLAHAATQYVVVQISLGGLTDTQTFPKLVQGSNGVTALLTNDSCTVTADSSGTVTGGFGSAGGTMQVYSGTALIPTGSIAFSVASSSGVSISISASGVYTISGMSADTGTATLRANYSGVNYDKVYSIAKSKAGPQGPQGNNGNPGSPGASSITLIPRGGCTVSGGTISKSSGSGWGSGDCYTSQSFTNGSALSFQPASTAYELMVALNTDPTTDESYTSLDYAIYLNNLGEIRVYESGAQQGPTYGTYAAGDIFQIVYNGSTINYIKNGTSFRTSSGVGSNKTFYFDSAFNQTGGQINNVTFAKAGADGTGVGTAPSQAIPISSIGTSNTLSYLVKAGVTVTVECQVYANGTLTSGTMSVQSQVSNSGAGVWSAVASGSDSYSSGDAKSLAGYAIGTYTNSTGSDRMMDFRVTSSGTGSLTVDQGLSYLKVSG